MQYVERSWITKEMRGIWSVGKFRKTVYVSPNPKQPVVRDAPLFKYCEIVDLLLQATRSPRIWRWPEGLDEDSIFSYEQVYSVGFL